MEKVNDKDIELFIGRLLRIGVFSACGVAIIGGVLYLLTDGRLILPDYKAFNGEPAGYTSFSGILKGMLSGSAKEIIQFGVVVLIATPVLRILLSLCSFILEKDRLYIVITTIVLSIILFSMFSGLKV